MRPRNGNTGCCYDAFKAIENGDYKSLTGDTIDTGESYDLVIVGGGLSGLGQPMNLKSPLQGRQNVLSRKPSDLRRCGKKNEFMVQGERLIDRKPQMPLAS